MTLKDLLEGASVDDKPSLHALCQALVRRGYDKPFQGPRRSLDEISAQIEEDRFYDVYCLSTGGSKIHLRVFGGRALDRTKEGRAFVDTRHGGFFAKVPQGWVLCGGTHDYASAEPRKVKAADVCRTCLKSFRNFLEYLDEYDAVRFITDPFFLPFEG